MKLLVIILSCLGSSFVLADEYRYSRMATTGLQERVFDQDGKNTTIVFSRKSNAEARFVLARILKLGGISGTKGAEQWHGVRYEQAIVVKGKLDPRVLRTASAPNSAEAEDYQEFFLDQVMIRFPIVRHRPGKVFDTAYLETHFSFDTLFPDGLMFAGKKVDFEKHIAKSGSFEDGEPD